MGVDVRATDSTANSPRGSQNTTSQSLTVQAGETKLADVAKRLGVSTEALLQSNPQIKDKDQLTAGQVLHLPAGGNTPAAKGPAPGSSQSKVTQALAQTDPWGAARAATTASAHAKPAPLNPDALKEWALQAGAKVLGSAANTVATAGTLVNAAVSAAPPKPPFAGDVPGSPESEALWNDVSSIAFDPKQDPDLAIQVLAAYRDMSPATSGQMIGLHRQEVAQLLAPFGFTGYRMDKSGGLSDGPMMASFDDAVRLWQNSNPQHRQELRAQNPPGAFAGITADEIAHREQTLVAGQLPNGAQYQGTKAAYREQEMYAYGEVLLNRIERIVNSGPASLVGRVIGGETGAKLGDFFDAGLMVVSGRQASRDVQNYEGSAGLEVRQATPEEIETTVRPPAADPWASAAETSEAINQAPVEPAPPPSKTVDQTLHEALNGQTPAQIRASITPAEIARAKQDFADAWHAEWGDKTPPPELSDKQYMRMALGDRIYFRNYNPVGSTKPASISQAEYENQYSRYDGPSQTKNGWHLRENRPESAPDVNWKDTDVRRIYMNVQPDHAVELADYLADHLNQEGISFQFKIPAELKNFRRSDAGVLLVEPKDYAKVKQLVTQYNAAHPDAFAQGTPGYTKPIAKGIAAADEPKQTGGGHPMRGGRVSFGESRSDAIAETILEAKDGETEEQIEARLRKKLERNGVDPDRPWLEGRKQDDL